MCAWGRGIRTAEMENVAYILEDKLDHEVLAV